MTYVIVSICIPLSQERVLKEQSVASHLMKEKLQSVILGSRHLSRGVFNEGWGEGGSALGKLVALACAYHWALWILDFGVLKNER